MSGLVKRFMKALLVCAAVASVLALVLPTALGLQRYVIIGGSMTGTIAKGSVVYARVTPAGELRVGDIITFVPPGMPAPVTHRIVSISTGPTGESVFRTKGDYNQAVDPWRATFPQSSVARYVYHVPYLGYVLALLAIVQVRVLMIALPALLIAFSTLRRLWRSAGDELQRRELDHLIACLVTATSKAEAGA
jgi:signal peptidase